MALKAVISKEDHEKLEQGLKSLYAEKDGKFVLELEGAELSENVAGLKSALEKERKERKKAADDYKALAEKFQDIDPEKAREAMKKAEELADKELIDKNKIEELVLRRTERMKAAHDQQISGFNTKIKELEDSNRRQEARLSEVLIEDALRQVALKPEIGFRPEAMRHLILSGREIWKIQDGKPVPTRADGTVIYGKDPNVPMSMEEWVTGLRSEFPYLFGESGGGGTPHGGKGTKPNKKRSEMTNSEKAAFIGEHGQEAYLNLPA